MKILVVGATGMLGFCVHRTLHDAGFDVLGGIRRIPPRHIACRGLQYLSGFDAHQPLLVRQLLRKMRPDIVVNTAVCKQATSVDGATQMIQVNSGLPRVLEEECTGLGTYFIQVSTDGVFSGDAAPYGEDALPDARDLYGLTKLLGEPQAGLALTLRTSIVGRTLGGGGSLLDWVIASRGMVRGYRDSVFSGVTVLEVARFIQKKLLSGRPKGLLHLAGPSISKFELLNAVRDVWSLDELTIVASSDVTLNRTLSSDRLVPEFSYACPSWPVMLADLKDFYQLHGI